MEDWGLLNGWIWLRIGTGGGLLWMRWWAFVFYKMRGISWETEDLVVSQKIFSMHSLVIFWTHFLFRLNKDSSYRIMMPFLYYPTYKNPSMLSLNANEGKFMIFTYAVVFDFASFVSEVTWNCPHDFTFRLSCDTQYFLCLLCQEFVQPCGTSFYVDSRTVIFDHSLYILYLSA